MDDPSIAAVSPRLLFLPVSGKFGMGEYARSLAIAGGIAQRWPLAAIHFMLSRAAPYVANVPFPHTLLDGSPTLHSTAVLAFMHTWRPNVVIFDNAGRGSQVRAARDVGARVVYISARPRQRRKAFRLRWMRRLDEHWIAYPRFIAGPLSFGERLKLALLRRPTMRYLDVVLTKAADAESADGIVLARHGVAAGGYVLLVPGGGTGHRRAANAVAIFAAAASGLAAEGFAVVLASPPLPQAQLGALMRGARLIVSNGGSTLMQGIASGKACLAIPIAGDQAQRIERCVLANVAAAARLECADIVSSAIRIMRQEGLLEALAQRARALQLEDGVAVAVRAIAGLLAVRSEAQ